MRYLSLPVLFFSLFANYLLAPGSWAAVFEVLIPLGKKPFPGLHLMSLMNDREDERSKGFAALACEEVELACKQQRCGPDPCAYFRPFSLRSGPSSEVTITSIVCESEAERKARTDNKLDKEQVHLLEDFLSNAFQRVETQLTQSRACQKPSSLDQPFSEESVLYSYVFGAFVPHQTPRPSANQTQLAHELLGLKSELTSLKKPEVKLLDGDLEDALARAKFEYPSKTIYSNPSHPNFLVKADAAKKRFQTATLLRSFVQEFQIPNVVVPHKEIVYLPDLDAPALIVEKLPLELDQAKVKLFYESLSQEEAAHIAFTVLKSRLRDIGPESGLQNLPLIQGTRSVAVIDTGSGTLDVDADLITAYNEFTQIFAPKLQKNFRVMTQKLLGEIKTPKDLLREP